ncbi:hypothetical protein DES39_1844 [Orbus hercynius]|uniref:MFS transporter n=1 Tax=Orbus hercynius TaxID=593135 RepID=A0A495RBS7_9GAMM|nr:hypothetical protein [Orbus hercynius]RKS84634.1 hypothetical protein DES39_1844 [Orbus hercynius]
MENNVQYKTRWTWADLVSSYQFWGLILFSFFIATSSGYTLHYLMMYTKMSLFQYSNGDLGLAINLSSLGLIFAIILGWIASRLQSYFCLYLYALFIIITLIIIYFYVENLIILAVASFIINALATAISLLVAASIAKAVDKMEFFVLAFGLISLMGYLNNFFSAIFWQGIMDKWMNIHYGIIFVIAFIIVSILLLIPVKKSLFSEAPPIRRFSNMVEKDQHDSIAVFLLLVFIPFYFIYWCVRAHRDIRHYSQSARLLTPTAAGWCALLVPFAIPIMLVNLSDTIDEFFSQSQKSKWRFILLSVFLLPLAILVVQNRLNHLSNLR